MECVSRAGVSKAVGVAAEALVPARADALGKAGGGDGVAGGGA